MAQHSSMHPPAGTPGVTRHHSAIRQTHITAGRPYPPPFHRTPGPSQAYEFGPGNLSTPVGAPMFGDDTGLDTGSPRLGGEGAFGSQYSASPGSPFMQPTDFQLAAFVDQIANLCGHSEAERLALHEISQMPFVCQMVQMFALVQKCQRQQDILLNKVNAQEKRLEELDAKIMAEWKPSAGQKKALKTVLRHFSCKNISQYDALVSQTKVYIKTKRAELHLPSYPADLLVKQEVDAYLNKEVHNVKSALRKMLFTYCGTNGQGGASLNTMVHAIMEEYHCGPYTEPFSLQTLARFALLRTIATPKAKEKAKAKAKSGQAANESRATTGFWKEVDKALLTMPNPKDSAKMEEWCRERINKDRELHAGDDDGANDDLFPNFAMDQNAVAASLDPEITAVLTQDEVPEAEQSEHDGDIGDPVEE